MDSSQKKSIAAISSVIWSALLTVMKFVVGIMTGSLGIISEALHSALDLLAAGGTLFAVRVAARPADEDHPYGHGKIENLTALGETLLLLITSGWVIMEAVERLSSDDPEALHIETSIWAFLVVMISLAVDINRSVMLRRVAQETKSAALEADAAHFTTDIWSSAAVLLGITGAALADMTAEGSWLHWFLKRADVFASLIVAILILHVCRLLGMRAVHDLMDRTSGETTASIRRLMKEQMPAYPVSKLRVREVGTQVYVDMVILAPKSLHVDTAHEIADAIEGLVARTYPNSETMVHIQPMNIQPTTPEMFVRQLALTHRFGVHGLLFLHSDQGYIIFSDVELPPEATLDTWQVPLEAFRNEIRRHLGADQVILHAEPNIRELDSYPETFPALEEWNELIRQTMLRMGAPLPQKIKVYTRDSQRLCIISIPRENGLTVAESHSRLSLMTKRLAVQLPQVARIVITYETPDNGI